MSDLSIPSPNQSSGDGVAPVAKGRVMVIAGSDSGGGAGIQADIKAIAAMGGYAMTAITAVTAQNTQGVHGVYAIPLHMIRQQIAVCIRDLGADAVKTGMLGTRGVVEQVAESLDGLARLTPRVIDPVMVAKGGSRLLDDSARDALASLLIPNATLLTPNAPEAEVLTRLDVDGLNGQRRAAEKLLRAGAKAVLVKGGHIPGRIIVDVLASDSFEHFFESERFDTSSTHGTGCTLASAIAGLLARGFDLVTAVEIARDYVRSAIQNAPGFGAGHGPLNHFPAYQPPELRQ